MRPKIVATQMAEVYYNLLLLYYITYVSIMLGQLRFLIMKHVFEVRCVVTIFWRSILKL
jgi:hypothetical protein